MKKTLLLAVLLMAAAGQALAGVVNVSGSITSDTRWTANNFYVLSGFVYVETGATLTIDAGTVIKGDKTTKGTLIIERGAKIMAAGRADRPIVFTSNQNPGARSYGDWGGVIICGAAPTNFNSQNQQVEGGPRSLYGGTNPADNSGVFQFVRIEFGGIAFSPNNEVNSLTLCGVGNGTTIDHVQVSYGQDDGFEWFGGNVNSKYLVSFRTWDDDFDNDAAYQGKNQFVVSLRDPNIADISGSKSFESDGYLSGSYSGIPYDAAKANSCVYSNVTIIGPLATPTTPLNNGNYVAAVHLRRGTAMSLLNSVIVGYPAGVLFDESSAAYGSTSANIANGSMQFRNNIIAGIPNASGGREIVYVKNGARELTSTNTNADTTTGSPFSPFSGPYSWLLNPAFDNRIYATQSAGVRLTDPITLTNPNLLPTSSSPIVFSTRTFGTTVRTFDPTKPINYDTTNLGANYNVPLAPPDFTNSKASDPFFTKVNYVGAFTNTSSPTDNWMAGWTEFNPINKSYDTAQASGIFNVASAGSIGVMNVYPNPAASFAKILMNMTQSAEVRIALVDVTGKTVQVLQNGRMDKGQHFIRVELENIPAGFYTIYATTADGVKAAKLNVVK